MKGDFTRRTFRRRHHYRGVLLQQGRVQLDADWNEQIDIQIGLDRTVTRDTIGRHGGPLGGAGMAITLPDGSEPTDSAGADLRISAGCYYVDGVLCENEDEVPLDAQPDLPGVALPASAGRYVAYLDVWTEHVTAVERPALREVALGGPDTATRARTVWQVRLAPVGTQITCADLAPPWAPAGSDSTGYLRARAQAPEGEPKPCVVPTTAGYRRLENQLYRVEIHDGGDAGSATYVWSRDNGSVVARLVTIAGNTLTIDEAGRDERLGFAKKQWVEVIDTDRIRRGEHGYLGRLEDAVGTELTVAEWHGPAPTSADLHEPVVVRRWDSPGAVPVAEDWVDLEDGVQIQFEAGGRFHTGDYWLIPARTANLQGGQLDPDLTGDVEWPRDAARKPLFQPREGIEHRFAAVALLDLAGGMWTMAADCRRLFPPLTELTELTELRYAGGDGQEAMPGDPLPQPLEVSVSNLVAAVPGATVRFSAPQGNGWLAKTEADVENSVDSTVEVVTGPDGVAGCFWRPAGDMQRRSQRVTARLLGPDGTAVDAPVHFSASLSIADQVWVDPGDCATLTGVRTVQDALDRLVSVRSLVAVGGDGQVGRPGADLPLPVSVIVRTDCGAVAGATVACAVTSGAVAASSGGDVAANVSTVDILTDEDGVARCFWRLGDEPAVQVLTAVLQSEGVPDVQPVQLAFTANLDLGPEIKPGLHVTDVVLLGGNQTLPNDSFVVPGDLMEGVGVVLDGAPVEAMVDGKPVLTLTLDLPFPFAVEDQKLWGPDVFGTQPLTLAGDVTLGQFGGDPTVIWTVSAASRTFLLSRLFTLLDEFKRADRVLCHLTLTGSAIADSDRPDRRVVNGRALGRPRGDGGTDLELPTVDDVRGADFTLWFWLVPPTIEELVMVPRRAGLFQFKTVRDTIDLAVPRDQLRGRIPDGTRVGEGRELDLDGARQAADRAFRYRAERRLVIVTDERYAGAASVIGDALGQVDVLVEVISAADPVAVARARVEAGEQLDGVLTDNASIKPITDLGGFTEAIPL
jgi:hypothetical protein